jgi:predicted secreted Zn-dependent protease
MAHKTTQPESLFMRHAPFHALALVLAAPALQAAEPQGWKPNVKVETYAISGQSSRALYASIGEHGPMVRGGKTRAIAYTDFKLTWQRTYENPNGGCVLSAARPTVTIVYRFPKPAEKLPPEVKANWDRFYAGIAAHEHQHGEFITAMVSRMVKESVGLSADNDPTCKKVRGELTRRLGAASREKGQKDLNFDRTEMSDGGNVRQLVMTFVNGW